MGLFLSMSGVVQANQSDLVKALTSFAVSHQGSMRKASKSPNDVDTLVLLGSEGKWTVLYPSGFFQWDEVSKYLSDHLKVPVFSFHIHDGDLWMFVAFQDGEEKTRFNPLPEYWSDSMDEVERQSWAGDAEAVAKLVPGLNPNQIQPYFKHWNLEDENPGKAFENDEFNFQDCWQVCDFMRRLGFKYPLRSDGSVEGETYEFSVP